MSESAQRAAGDRELARDADTLPAPAPVDSSLPPPPSVPALWGVAHNFAETLAPPAPSAPPAPVSALRPTADAASVPPASIPGAPPAPSCFTETLVPPSLDEELKQAESA